MTYAPTCHLSHRKNDGSDSIDMITTCSPTLSLLSWLFLRLPDSGRSHSSQVLRGPSPVTGKPRDSVPGRIVSTQGPRDLIDLVLLSSTPRVGPVQYNLRHSVRSSPIFVSQGVTPTVAFSLWTDRRLPLSHRTQSSPLVDVIGSVLYSSEPTPTPVSLPSLGYLRPIQKLPLVFLVTLTKVRV